MQESLKKGYKSLRNTYVKNTQNPPNPANHDFPKYRARARKRRVMRKKKYVKLLKKESNETEKVTQLESCRFQRSIEQAKTNIKPTPQQQDSQQNGIFTYRSMPWTTRSTISHRPNSICPVSEQPPHPTVTTAAIVRTTVILSRIRTRGVSRLTSETSVSGMVVVVSIVTISGISWRIVSARSSITTITSTKLSFEIIQA